MQNEETWRTWINSLSAGDLPEDGVPSPETEKLPKRRAKGIKSPKDKFFVSKVVTEIIIYSDIDNHKFGQTGFQQMYILGEMTGDRLLKLLESEARKRESGN